MATAQATYNEVRDTIKALRAHAAEAARQAFGEGAVALFAEYPLLQSFAFTQYTPYFNDGDPCEFGVSDVAKVNGTDNIHEAYDWRGGHVPASNPELIPVQEAANRFVHTFDNDDMLAMFGDHVEVTVSRGEDGAALTITCDEYEHD